MIKRGDEGVSFYAGAKVDERPVRFQLVILTSSSKKYLNNGMVLMIPFQIARR